jgi:hypothetical protein
VQNNGRIFALLKGDQCPVGLPVTDIRQPRCSAGNRSDAAGVQSQVRAGRKPISPLSIDITDMSRSGERIISGG